MSSEDPNSTGSLIILKTIVLSKVAFSCSKYFDIDCSTKQIIPPDRLQVQYSKFNYILVNMCYQTHLKMFEHLVVQNTSI